MPVIKDPRAVPFSPLMTQQRKKKTKQNTIDLLVQDIAKGEG